MPPKLAKPAIAQTLQFTSGYSKRQASEMIDTLIETIKQTLETGEHVLVSGFGKFSVKLRNERCCRNPNTGENVIVPPRKVVTFKCSEKLRKLINKGNSVRSGSETKAILDRYFSVQISLFGLYGVSPTYLFKLRETSLNGLCILVNKDSAVIEHLKVGDILGMKYISTNSSGSNKIIKTRIKNISRNHNNCFTGNFIVELSTMEPAAPMPSRISDELSCVAPQL